MFRQLFCNRPSRFDTDLSRALVIKDESHGVRAGVDRAQRIFQIGCAANLYPGHEKPALSSQFSVLGCRFIRAYSARDARYSQPASAVHLRETSPASATL